MEIEEVKGILGYFSLRVEVRPTKELFPYSTVGNNPQHFSVVCQSHADQRRVHHWIEFRRPDFENFDLWAAYVEAITERGPYAEASPCAPTQPNNGGLSLPPGLVC